tara:strand:- start:2270 stop:2434 length:165 start_codon:yes stop_codon:yes gene_type:complete
LTKYNPDTDPVFIEAAKWLNPTQSQIDAFYASLIPSDEELEAAFNGNNGDSDDI